PAARRRRGDGAAGAGRGPGDGSGGGHPGAGPARGRQLRLGRLPDRRPGAAGGGAGDRRRHPRPGGPRAPPGAPSRCRGTLRPLPGAEVRRAGGEERAQALYFDQMDRKVPVGLGRDGEPIYLNLEFLDGTRGAHVSISGISGVATKTSFALFLLHSIFRSGVLGPRAVNAKALVFSVKGEDLLFLDRANRRLDDELRARYATLGLPAEPFAPVGFLAPPRPDDIPGRPNVTGRTAGVDAFWWTPAEFCERELLPYVFTDAEDDRQQYTTVVHQVTGRLRREARSAGPDGAVTLGGGTLGPTYDELGDLVVDRGSHDGPRGGSARPGPRPR